MSVRGEHQLLVSKPRVGRIQPGQAFAEQRQGALAVHFNNDGIGIDFDFAIILDECVIKRLLIRLFRIVKIHVD